MTSNDEPTESPDSSPDFAAPRDIRDSHHDAEGDMGVSSERVGHTGPGQQGTDGIKDTSEVVRDPDADVPPEQTTGQPEPNPEGLEPKAGYSSVDPRNPD
jgi:hypothetical protein